MSDILHEPMPALGPDDLPTAVVPLVIQDIIDKSEAGIAKYTTPLYAPNGRNFLKDLYQELIDATKYLKGELVLQALAAGEELPAVSEEVIPLQRYHDTLIELHRTRQQLEKLALQTAAYLDRPSETLRAMLVATLTQLEASAANAA